jgi:hypothetical protein
MNVVNHIDTKKGYGYIDIVHRDEYGYEKQRYRQKIDSFIQQAWIKFYLFALTNESGSYVRVSGTSLTPSSYHNFRAGSSANGVRGILIGTGTGAAEYANVNLGTRTVFGTSSNQLSSTGTIVTFDNDTGTATLNRIFTNNNSTTSPTVGEIGISVYTSDSTDSLLIVRDRIDPTIQLFWKDTLEITYTLDFTGGNINWNMLFGKHWFARNTTNVSFFNQSGSYVEGSFDASDKYPRFVAEPSKDNGGITVGLGDSSETFNTTSLDSKIFHGASTNQLIYGATQYSYTNTVNSNYTEISFIRTFKNESSSNVVIKEIGLESNVEIGGSDTNVLFARRVVSPITIEPSKSKKISWVIRYDF